MNFSELASVYHELSTVQASAGDLLIALLRIRGDEDILDVGCGTGKLTKKLRSITKGRVVGTDVSEAMVAEARKNNCNSPVDFFPIDAGHLNRNLGFFDIIFCNSTFQWFRNPKEVVRIFYSLLRYYGKVGIQAPATQMYCPNFIQATHTVENDPHTMEQFSHFRSPWFFLESATEYSRLFHDAGFSLLFSDIDATRSLVTPEEAFDIFSSGAIAGYLNQDFYAKPYSNDYAESFKEIVKQSLIDQADETGKVDLCFNRIFLVGIRD